ncbi:MAG: citrate synthase/methylcitrate synthase [bacterium]|nr:citrate synthase/methylcitrate synthase [bacterium]MCY3890081.1 citrate synthase/methylcitrate synthase [bacterium]
MGGMNAVSPLTENIAPPGLKGLIVADTLVGSVRRDEGWYHYRGHSAAALARSRSFEAVAHLLLNGTFPDRAAEEDFRSELAAARRLTPDAAEMVSALAKTDLPPMSVLRGVLGAVVDPRPTLDLDSDERRDAVMQAIGITPTVMAAVNRIRSGAEPLKPDESLSHSADYLRMTLGETPLPEHARAVETYLCLTADHGFNASTFTARVITSTGTDVAGAMCGALAALAGPLHGGAPGRVLDMLHSIGHPDNAVPWIAAELDASRKIMGFGHAVYRAADPRSETLKAVAIELGGELVDRALDIESRILAYLAEWKPDAVIVTNVEFYAGVVLHLSGLPQEAFTPTFTTSRVVGWAAHLLEQAANNKIMRPSARYTGPLYNST